MKQSHISVREYSFKFTKFSKYTPFIVVDPRSKMNKFIFKVSELLSKERKMVILMKEMDISYLITYIEQIKEEKLIERLRSPRGLESTKGLVATTTCGQRQMSHGSTNTPHPRFSNDKGSNPKPQEGLGAQAYPNYTKYRRPYKGKYLVSSNICFICGKPDHHARDCRNGGSSPQGQGVQAQGDSLWIRP